VGDTDQVVFDQYKIATEMADRVSARRGTANGFYFTVGSALLAAAESLGLSIASGAGLVLTAAWWLQLRSYRNLNAAKWAVISKLEDQLPTQPFSDEWTILKTDAIERQTIRFPWLAKRVKPLARYAELSVVEQVVPALFFVLFAISLGQALT
jgi:hypothetical protein